MEKTLQQRMQDPSQEVRLAAIAERDKIFTDEGEELRLMIMRGEFGIRDYDKGLEARLGRWFGKCQDLCYFYGPGKERELGDKHGVAMVELLIEHNLKRLIPPYANWKIGFTQ